MAARVFELCDGRATVRELAAVTAERLGQPVGRETVGDALALLAECELLCPGSVQGAGVSRRQSCARLRWPERRPSPRRP
jgi:hypothetical protein